MPVHIATTTLLQHHYSIYNLNNNVVHTLSVHITTTALLQRYTTSYTTSTTMLTILRLKRLFAIRIRREMRCEDLT